MPHLLESLFGITVYYRVRREGDVLELVCVAVKDKAEICRCCFGKRHRNGRIGHKAHVERGVLTVEQNALYHLVFVAFLCVKRSMVEESVFLALQRNAAHSHRRVAVEVERSCAAYLLLCLERAFNCEVGKGDYLNVLRVFAYVGQLNLDFLSARHFEARACEVAHGLLGFYPRASALAPSGAVENAHFYV